MNNELLFSKLNLVTVSPDGVMSKIEEMSDIINNGNQFASQLSINRYLPTKLVDLDADKRLNLFSYLREQGFFYDVNSLYWGDLTFEHFEGILKKQFKLDNIFELDNFFIESLLNGDFILDKKIELFDLDEDLYFGDVLERFVIAGEGLDIGDTPPLMLMLTVKKALLGTYIAKVNIEKLANGDNEYYDLSVLF